VEAICPVAMVETERGPEAKEAAAAAVAPEPEAARVVAAASSLASESM